MRTELVSTVAVAEAYNTQSSNGRVKYYAVEREERLCVNTKCPVLNAIGGNVLIAFCAWNNSTHIKVTAKPHLPTKCWLCDIADRETHRKLCSTRGVLPLYDFKIYRKPPN